MKMKEVDARAIADVVSALPDRFCTKDVSEHAIAMRAHVAELGEGNYHSTIGRYLSAQRAALGIRLDRRAGDRGAHWAKVAGARLVSDATCAAIAGSTAPAAATADVMDIGPQYAGDRTFTARMRFHQSHYRATVLHVPCGTGPTKTSQARYGNMLLAKDADHGRNFVTPEVFAVVRARLAEGSDRVEPFRLHHNMLSSQPLCFNLFGPLVGQPERAARLLGSLFPGEIETVREVRIEHAPSPASDYLADRTSFDAFVDYVRPDGVRALMGIETKLTDDFSPAVKDGERYRRWMSGPRSPFLAEAGARVQLPIHNQLWRNHLLALAMRDHSSSPYGACRSVVVHHALDDHGAGAVASYRSLLRPDQDSFAVATLDTVLAAFARTARGAHEQAWLGAFRARYLDLAASEVAWRARGPAGPG